MDILSLFSEVNLLAVLVATLAAMVVGSLWYSPVLFGNAWIRMSDLDMAKMSRSPLPSMVMGFVATFVSIYFLAVLLLLLSPLTLTDALLLGGIVWLALPAPISFGAFTWEQRPFALFLLNAAYWLVMLLMTFTILFVWSW